MVHISFRRRRTVVVALGALAGTAVALSGGAAADTTTTSYSSSCSATLLSLSIAGNGGATPPADCAKPGDALVPPIDLSPLPVRLRVLYETASTSHQGTHAKAETGVAHVEVPLGAASGGQLPDVTVDVLTSEAGCHDGVPSGSSKVVNVVLGAPVNQTIAVPPGQAPTLIDLSPLPLVISLNGQDTSQHSASSTVGQTTTTTLTRSLTQTALRLEALGGTPATIELVVARSHVDCTTTTRTVKDTPPPPPSGAVGWMNGGGRTGTTVTTHGFVLPCTTTQHHPGPNLTVQVPNGKTFKLTSLGDVSCSTVQGNGDPEQPDAGFNTLRGSGTGTCDGKGSGQVRFTFTDGGEPGAHNDQAVIDISGACSLHTSGYVSNGNQQAHRRPHPPA